MLKQHLIDRITSEGPMNIADFMQECLYNEDYGYYMTKTPFGTDGDFTTAPEISQLFGEMIGAWVADTWIKMGRPSTWSLIEAGPGRGTLMKDMLRTLKHALPEAYEGMSITLLEISPHLKLVQRDTLQEHAVQWATNIDMVDFSNPTIFVANELLDAFPIRQYVKNGESFKERLVTWNNDVFDFTEGNDNFNFDVTSTYYEQSDAMESFLCKLKDKLTNGAALFVDYGDKGTGDSLQALHKHKKVSILENVGEADITAHVNFDNVQQILGTERTSEMEHMGTFLTSIGLPVRAAALLERATAEQKESIEQGAYRLLHPEQMGELFKAMAYRTNEDWELAGFYFKHAQKSHACSGQCGSKH